jgi:hypothetical protein
MKKPIEIINIKKAYINEIKERANSILEALPIIDEIEAVTNWEEQAFSNIPSEAEEVPTNNLVENLQNELIYLVTAFPLPPKYDPSLIGGTISMTSSGSTSAFEFIGLVGDIGTPYAIDYSNTYKLSFMALQSSQNRVDAVRSFINRFNNPDLSSRFENCVDSISQYHVTVLGKRESTANFIRNLLYGVSGQLFELARKHPKENMSWREMAKRLANSSSAEAVIFRQEKEQSNLISRTSDVLKDHGAGSLTNIDNIWVQTLEHLYILSNSLHVN